MSIKLVTVAYNFSAINDKGDSVNEVVKALIVVAARGDDSAKRIVRDHGVNVIKRCYSWYSNITIENVDITNILTVHKFYTMYDVIHAVGGDEETPVYCSGRKIKTIAEYYEDI